MREWGLARYDTLSAFALALGISPQNLGNYLSGRMPPGNKTKARLRRLGCDIQWLMTGKTSTSPIDSKVETPYNPSPSQVENLRPVFATIAGGLHVIAERPVMYEPLPPGAEDRGEGVWIIADGKFFNPAITHIFINPTVEVKDGDIVVAVWEAEPGGVIRQVQFTDKDIILTPILPPIVPIVVRRKSIIRMEKITHTRMR